MRRSRSVVELLAPGVQVNQDGGADDQENSPDVMGRREPEEIDRRAQDAVAGKPYEEPVRPPPGADSAVTDGAMHHRIEEVQVPPGLSLKFHPEDRKPVVGIGEDDIGIHDAGNDHHDPDQKDVVGYPLAWMGGSFRNG